MPQLWGFRRGLRRRCGGTWRRDGQFCHAATAPPSPAMNSRLRIGHPSCLPVLGSLSRPTMHWNGLRGLQPGPCAAVHESAAVQVFGRRHPRCQPRAPAAGVQKAPRHEIAVGERRRCRNYGDFAAGSGVDVVERGGNVGNFARRHVRELNCERVTDRLCNAILHFCVLPNGNIDVTTQGITLSAGSQHRH